MGRKHIALDDATENKALGNTETRYRQVIETGHGVKSQTKVKEICTQDI